MVAKKRAPKKVATKEAVVDTPVMDLVRQPRRGSFFSRALPFAYIALLGLAFFTGTLWQKVQYLESGAAKAPVAADPAAQAGQATPAPVTQEQIKGLFSEDLIKFGNDSAPVLFVAVEDPSCPYCHIASGKNPELNDQSGSQFKLVSKGGTYVPPMIEMKKLVDSGQASLVYIYTPGHGAGEMGQKALYCAFEKGKFWQAHDLMYSNAGYKLLNDVVQNDKAKSGQVADFLKSVMPVADMKACLDSGKYDARLTADSSIAQSLSVFGTPGFFVNTTRYAGAYSYKDMESSVNAALGK